MSLLINQFLKPNGLYFLNHSMGCLNKNQEIAKELYFHSWKNKGGNSWEEWLPYLENFHKILAEITFSKSKNFCYQINNSSALLKIIHAIPKNNKRKKIILSDLEFPSMQFIFNFLPKDFYEFILIKSKNGRIQTEQWLNEIDDKTLFLLVSHVTYGNSFKQPIVDIANKCRKFNVISILDLAQSIGVIPINLENSNFDFAIGSCLKWLCGGTGTGFIWANSSVFGKINSNAFGWFGMENIFAENIDELKKSSNSSQFMDGTPCILPLMLAIESIKLLNNIGFENIYKKNQEYISYLHSYMQEKPKIKVLSPLQHDERGGTFVFSTKNDEQFLNYLKQEKVFVDSKPNYGIRFSPHIYNTWDEIYKFKEIVENFEF
ncbi:aminotransferase class V-fold PLP-dependent enzyme [Pigmentibacter sp. JX0631]|uniref:aminotransferase class V-fold PLP-dependent enzyme n=1 Tax=Pigmentibacter sp. JX0631 TaxID=2976982 RepID=UPI0024689C39|nr:aminotransferase class V-fold PLP-dependent enzyme [Pigmentibacter sp. JX0631]WGL59154.1 aminotransferase class V-fold PLP-dependent enzyme [Pigmentibacter sp. JX0631]